jgi:hypothetical protein
MINIPYIGSEVNESFTDFYPSKNKKSGAPKERDGSHSPDAPLALVDSIRSRHWDG